MTRRPPQHPAQHPRLARALLWSLVAAVSLVVLGAPVWFFMHGTASAWTDERIVTVRVPADAECRTGPPPGRPQTCEGTWTDPDLSSATGSSTLTVEMDGEVSDRYGGPAPERGAAVEARVVEEGLAFTGYQGVLLRWALVSPYVAVAGLLLGALALTGLVRFDPRWSSPGTDLPPPVRTARATPGTGRRRSAAPRARGSRAAGGSGRHTARRRAPRRRRGR